MGLGFRGAAGVALAGLRMADSAARLARSERGLLMLFLVVVRFLVGVTGFFRSASTASSARCSAVVKAAGVFVPLP